MTMDVTFFFFNDTATTEIYTLSLHDALPIFRADHHRSHGPGGAAGAAPAPDRRHDLAADRSEEHTSELQSHLNLVCRLLLEKKNLYPPNSQPHYRLSLLLFHPLHPTPPHAPS